MMAPNAKTDAKTLPNTRTIHAVCTHDCPDSCGVLVTVDQLSGRATKLHGDPAHPVTRGFLCAKVARYLDRVYSPDRLLYPMRRRPGVPKGPLPQNREAEAFERISWDDALDLAASKLSAIAAEHGPESILPYSYAGTIGQLGYGSMDRRFFHRLGASQLDRTICASAGGAALSSVYGIKLGTAPQDFAHAGLILAWGANIHGNNIHLWPFIEQARRASPTKPSARLIVIDPYRTRTAALADQHLAIRPGTDTLLALALMHVLFRDGLEDRAYLEACTHGAAEVRAHALLPQHSPENAAAITGIPSATIEELAQALGHAGRNGRPPAVIRMNYGIQRSESGGTAARAVAMLPLITGSWKHRGGGLLLSTSGSFPFNSARVQMPELMRQSPLGRPSRTINMNELGHALTGLESPPVQALFVYNCNAAAVAPDSANVLAGLRRPNLFTIVHEQFFTDTTDYADLIFPATTFLEAPDLMGAYGHLFAQINSPAIAPLGESRSNVHLFAALGQRLFPNEPAFLDTEADLIAQALDSTPEATTQHPWFLGITPATLVAEGQIPLRLPTNTRGETLPFSDATWFRTPSGRGELTPVPVFIAPTESRSGRAATPDFPLEFLPRKADNFMNTTFANLPTHQHLERRTSGILEMHPTDAAARNLITGDPVSVFNPRGRISLTASVGISVAPGVVAARLDWHKLSQDGANVNTLTSQRLTDIGGGATFYSTLVQVEKLPLPDPLAAA